MKRSTLISRLAAALALLLTLPAAAVQAPKEVIGKDTVAVVWVDVQKVTPKMIESMGSSLAGLGDNPALEQVGGAIPLGDIQKMVKQLTGFRNGFVKAGGSGLLMAFGMPGEGSWSPPMSMLAKSKGKVDADAMGALMTTMSDGVVTESKVNPLGDDWHQMVLTGAEGKLVTQPLPGPDDTAVKSFNRQLGEKGEPVVRVAFRVQDALRSMAGGMMEGVDQVGDPNMAMMAAVMEPLKALDTIGVSVSQVKGKAEDAIAIDVQMVFNDVQSATNFSNTYNMMLMFAPAAMAQQLQNVQGAPDPVEINNFFAKLRMIQDGDALRLKLDQAFFDMADQLRKKMQPGAQPPKRKNDVPI